MKGNEAQLWTPVEWGVKNGYGYCFQMLETSKEVRRRKESSSYWIPSISEEMKRSPTKSKKK